MDVRKNVVVAVDPGHARSAYAVLVRSRGAAYPTITHSGLESNEAMLTILSNYSFDGHMLAIEKLQGMGMAVGQEVLDTALWSGRFIQVWHPAPWCRVPRISVKVHLCGVAKAKDPNVRAAIMDRFGGASAKGTKAAPGPLYGVRADVWSAVGVGLTYLESDDRFNEGGKVA